MTGSTLRPKYRATCSVQTGPLLKGAPAALPVSERLSPKTMMLSKSRAKSRGWALRRAGLKAAHIRNTVVMIQNTGRVMLLPGAWPLSALVNKQDADCFQGLAERRWTAERPFGIA